MASDQRRRELAKIHCMKRDLGLDDEIYRDVLMQVGGKASSADLDAAGRARVISKLQADLGSFRRKGGEHKGRPHNMGSKNAPPELRKVEALLADMKLTWAYADGIAKHMFKVERVLWCNPKQLRAVVTALVMQQRRLLDRGAP